jgi:proline racemase
MLLGKLAFISTGGNIMQGEGYWENSIIASEQNCKKDIASNLSNTSTCLYCTVLCIKIPADS